MIRPATTAERTDSFLVRLPYCPLLALVLLLSNRVCEPCRGADTPAFEVEGTLDISSLNRDGSGFKSGTYGFSVIANRTCWEVKAIYGDDYYQVYGFDGTNVYGLLCEPVARSRNVVPGQIASGPYPPVATWHVTIPWLAYASRFYFSRNHSNEAVMPAPWRAASHETAAHIYRAHFPAPDPVFGIPTQINFVTDHSLLAQAQTNAAVLFWETPGLRQGPELLRGITRDKSLAASYHVMSSKQVQGMEVPSEFELAVFWDNGKPQLRMHGLATNICASSLRDFVPQTSMDISVTDFRFHNKNAGIASIKYVVSQGNWIKDPQSPRLLALLDASAKYQKGAMQSHRRFLFQVRFLFWLAVVAIIASPLLFARVRRWMRRRQRLGNQ